MPNLFLQTTRFIEILMESQTKKIEEPTVEQYDYCTAPSTRSEYIALGVKYHPDYTLNYNVSTGDNVTTKSTNDSDIAEVFKNFMNNSPYRSVWVDSDCDGTKDGLQSGSELTFSKKITVNSSKTVYVGLIGDNRFILALNGSDIVRVTNEDDTTNFNYLNIFPITLIAGENILSFTGIGDGSVNDALGVIIYDNPIDDILQPIPRSEWNVLFSSEETLGDQLNIVSCPEGYTYDDETDQCIQITSIEEISVSDFALISPTNLYNRTVDNWEIFYGDGNSESGTGDISQTFEHQYIEAGTYNAKVNIKYTDGSYLQGTKQIVVQ